MPPSLEEMQQRIAERRASGLIPVDPETQRRIDARALATDALEMYGRGDLTGATAAATVSIALKLTAVG